MRVAIDADQNGDELKRVILETLRERGINCTDLDYLASHPDDSYPDVACHLATEIQKRRFDRGILICGTGLGMAMCANKVPGVFAGTCHDVYSAERLRKGNNAQVLTLGALVVGPELAKLIALAFMRSEFQGGRSGSKVLRMRQLETEHLSHRSDETRCDDHC
jgi:ribose 5-phosphate isomerase B